MPDETSSEADLYLRALECEPGPARDAFLAEACGDNPQLRRSVEELLAAHDDPASILDDRHPADHDSPAGEQPGDRLGNYALIEQIGTGGMGTVWLAEQSEPVQRRVALKIIKLGMDSREVVARFDAERQAFAMMDHPGIAKVHDAGMTLQGRPFFVMEYVEGVPLTDYCDAHRLRTADRLRLFTGVCRAVQHAHQKGVVHRDLKPSNILVASGDREPAIKVIDFGIAKAIEEKLTSETLRTVFGRIVGTLGYMSPEQAGGESDVDTRSDVYSLGVVLYELLSGQLPLERTRMESAAVDAVLKLIREEDPPKPSTRLSSMGAEGTAVATHRATDLRKLTRSMRGDLDWIVMRALEKDRERRYETANALALDVERFLNNEAVAAGPPSATYRVRKWGRRHRSALAVTALLAVTLITATVISTRQAVMAIRARELASDRLNQSEQARREAESIAGFISEIFQSADPARDGRTITVAEKLDHAAERLKTDLTDQPALRAKLLVSLGRTYRSLGLPREAIELLEMAREHYLTSSLPGPGTAICLQELAGACYDASRWSEAHELQKVAYTIHRRDYGPESPITIESLSMVARCAYTAGSSKEALRLREEVLNLSGTVNGPEHPATLAAMAELGLSYRAVGRHAEACDLFEKALPLSLKVHGPKHPATLEAMRHLARSHCLNGDLDKAIPMQRDVLTWREEVSGPLHPETLLDMGWLARSYVAEGRADEALQLRETILEGRRKVLGNEHRDTLWAMANLAASYTAAGERAKALPLWEEVAPLRLKISGIENFTTRNAIRGLVSCYTALGRESEAQPWRAKLLEFENKGAPEEGD